MKINWRKLFQVLGLAAKETAPLLGNEKTRKIVASSGKVLEAATEEEPKK